MADTTETPARHRGVFLPILVCFAINMLDGFDILATAFTGPAIAAEWQIGPERLGLLFGAALMGMTVGSFLISPFADTVGRRRVTLCCLGIMAVGMALSGFAETLGQLMALRVLTGLGIGGILASLNTTVAELAPPHRRNLAIAFYSTGYAMGSIVGGLLSAQILASHNWRMVFTVGGALTAAMLIIAFFLLPETAARNGGARQRPADVLRDIRSSIASLVSADLRPTTLLICLSYFLIMISFYFILNWAPKIAVDMGLSLDVGITTTVMLNIAGLVGSFLFGFLADKRGVFVMSICFVFAQGVGITIYGFVPAVPYMIYTIAFLAGICMAGAITSLYGILPHIYPADVRATGTGFSIGIGRLGGTLGPVAAGYLIALGWDRSVYYAALALPALFAALTVFLIFRIVRARGSFADGSRTRA